MAKAKSASSSISAKEVLAEINLVSLIQQIETKVVAQPRTIRFAELADAYIGIGDYPQAIQLCENGLQNYPQYAPATLVLAKAYYRSGNKAKAKEILNQMLSMAPANAAVHKLLGDIALETNDIKTAVNRYRTVLRVDPLNLEVLQQMKELRDDFQKIKGDDEEERQTVEPSPPPVPKPEPQKKVEAQAVEEPKEATRKPKHSEADFLIKDDLVELAAKTGKAKEVADTAESAVASKATKTQIVPEVKIEPKKTEPIVQPVEKIPAPDLGTLQPAFTDRNGMLYFCVDDEVSFADHKKRKALVDAGKAVLTSRAVINDLIAASTPTTQQAARETPTDFVMETQFPVEETPVAPAEGTEDALDEVELTYKDYLDILTDEALLMEALFTEEEPYGATDDSELSLVHKLADEAVVDTPAKDRDVSYGEYVESLTDEKARHEATIDEQEISLAQYLNETANEPIDFATFLLTTDRAEEIITWLNTPVVEEPDISYRAYLQGLRGADLKEATLEAPPVEPAIEPKKDVPVEKKPKPVEPPVQKDIQKKVEPAVVQTPAAEKKTTTARVESDVEEVEYEEEVIEETTEAETSEIDVQNVTFETVDEYVRMGQFGTAYKACKVLKQKNPTDAKIDRKMLELKRLYLWSTQLAG